MPLSHEAFNNLCNEVKSSTQIGSGLQNIPILVRARIAHTEIFKKSDALKKINKGILNEVDVTRIHLTVQQRFGLLNAEGNQAMLQVSEEVNEREIQSLWNTCLTQPLFAPTILSSIANRLWRFRKLPSYRRHS